MVEKRIMHHYNFKDIPLKESTEKERKGIPKQHLVPINHFQKQTVLTVG